MTLLRDRRPLRWVLLAAAIVCVALVTAWGPAPAAAISGPSASGSAVDAQDGSPEGDGGQPTPTRAGLPVIAYVVVSGAAVGLAGLGVLVTVRRRSGKDQA